MVHDVNFEFKVDTLFHQFFLQKLFLSVLFHMYFYKNNRLGFKFASEFECLSFFLFLVLFRMLQFTYRK